MTMPRRKCARVRELNRGATYRPASSVPIGFQPSVYKERHQEVGAASRVVEGGAVFEQVDVKARTRDDTRLERPDPPECSF